MSLVLYKFFRKRNIILLAWTLCCFHINAQDTVHYYLDSTTTRITQQKDAAFHFVIYRDDNKWRVDKYKLDGNYLMETVHYKDKQLSVMHGGYNYYKAAGILSERGNYQDGMQIGWWVVYKTGMLTDSIFYKEGVKSKSFVFREGVLVESMSIENNKIHNNLYYPNGTMRKDVVTLTGGGISSIMEFDEQGRKTQKSEAVNGRMQVVQMWDTTGKKIKVKPYHEPEYPSGRNGLQSFIDREIRLPMRQRYRVYFPCQFGAVMTFDSNGNVESVKVIKSVNVDFDNIVSNSLKRMPAWNMHGAKSFTYTLMINFTDDIMEDDKPLDIIPNQQKKNF